VFLAKAFDQPAYWATYVVVVVVSIVLHELGHALAATWQGDPTPRIRGHLTWNPIVHMGWLSLAFLAAFGLAFGRTPVTPAYFRNRRWGEAMVSFAGPAVNLLLCAVGALAVVLLQRIGGLEASDWMLRSWFLVCALNAMLFLLNLLPLPPLDGFGVLEGTFDLGGLGAMLRSLYPLPLILAFVLVNLPGFQALFMGLASALIGAFALVVPG
jgi:Zn-dependent protease